MAATKKRRITPAKRWPENRLLAEALRLIAVAEGRKLRAEAGVAANWLGPLPARSGWSQTEFVDVWNAYHLGTMK